MYQTLERYREADGPFGGLADGRGAQPRDRPLPPAQAGARRAAATTRRCSRRMAAPDEHPIAGLEREERAGIVHRGLRALPPDLRLPLILCDLQGLPYDEIAAELSAAARNGEEPNQPCPHRAGEAPDRAPKHTLAGGARRVTSMDCRRAEELFSDALEGALHEILDAELERTSPAATPAAGCARPSPRSWPRCARTPTSTPPAASPSAPPAPRSSRARRVGRDPAGVRGAGVGPGRRGRLRADRARRDAAGRRAGASRRGPRSGSWARPCTPAAA